MAAADFTYINAQPGKNLLIDSVRLRRFALGTERVEAVLQRRAKLCQRSLEVIRHRLFSNAHHFGHVPVAQVTEVEQRERLPPPRRQRLDRVLDRLREAPRSPSPREEFGGRE